MKLKEYLIMNNINEREFARRVGCHYMTIYKHLKGQDFGMDLLRKVYAETKGMVQPNDYLVK